MAKSDRNVTRSEERSLRRGCTSRAYEAPTRLEVQLAGASQQPWERRSGARNRGPRIHHRRSHSSKRQNRLPAPVFDSRLDSGERPGRSAAARRPLGPHLLGLRCPRDPARPQPVSAAGAPHWLPPGPPLSPAGCATFLVRVHLLFQSGRTRPYGSSVPPTYRREKRNKVPRVRRIEAFATPVAKASATTPSRWFLL